MKQETTDALVRGGAAVAGTTTTWTLQDSNAVVALFVGVATFIFIVVQLFFLLRKWYKLEKSGWKSHDTDHTPLDEKKRE
jgi:hypothetical protein